MKTTRIVIAGIGGVGGYFGGLLSKHFEESDKVDICFLARGEHLKAIQEKGLKVIQGESEFVTRPTLATDTASEIGLVNFVIISTKSYDLEDSIRQLKPCIDDNTILLPLLNGVDSKERIEQLLPNNLVLNGCVYIVSRLAAPGVIANTGNIQKLFFGLDDYTNPELNRLENLFKEAGLEARKSNKISSIIWEKFIFISALATATSYFNCNIGELLNSEEKLETFEVLVEEVVQIANKKQVISADGLVEKTIQKVETMSPNATASMHSDFIAGKQSELETLTNYVIREGRKYGIETPTYGMAYEFLKGGY
ncbi:MAG: 2-dehydropantoate 2-reductase [Flammeovirgaceae bacterium]|jgi:2-dehydropantoate 2-reductase